MVAGTWRDQWMTTGVTKWGKTILTADRVWEHTAEAFRQMKTGIPQSTHLIFPSDVLSARFETPRQLSYYHDKSKIPHGDQSVPRTQGHHRGHRPAPAG